MDLIRWGMIGCGDVTEVKSGPAFQKVRNSSLVAVMRRNGALARDYAERHGVARWYDDASALIQDPEVNAIYIATPPSSHKQYALLSAAAGKPVYVEKPMALNFTECQEMIQACENAGVPLFVAYYRRALPRFLKVKELIDAGVIGNVRFVNVVLYQPMTLENVDAKSLPWRLVPEISGGGLFVDLASHLLDFLDFALGPIAEAQGLTSNQAGRYAGPDIVTGTFKFGSGVHGVGTWCFSGFAHGDLTEIVGDEGKISFSTFNAQPIIRATREGVQSFAIDYPQHIQQPLIQSEVDELNGTGKCPSKGETAARTSWVMDRMLGR